MNSFFQEQPLSRSFFLDPYPSESLGQEPIDFKEQEELSPDLPLSITNNIEEIDVFIVLFRFLQNSVQKLKQHALSKTEQDEYFRLEAQYQKNEQTIVQLVAVDRVAEKQRNSIYQLYSDYSIMQQQQIDEVRVLILTSCDVDDTEIGGGVPR